LCGLLCFCYTICARRDDLLDDLCNLQKEIDTVCRQET
jgi:hypothetical protein